MKYSAAKVTIVIPTKNEGKGLKKVIRAVKAYAKEIIIVDGHSTDDTREICKKTKVTYLLDNGKGKGEAIRIGATKAKTPIVIFMDADGSPDEKDIPKLIQPIIEKKADMVVSSRRTGGSYDFEITFGGILRTMGSDFLALLVNRKFGTNFSDILYCFRAIKTSVFRQLDSKANGFDFEQEVLIKAIRKKRKIIEIPSRERARAWGESKLKTISGIILLYDLLRELYLN